MSRLTLKEAISHAKEVAEENYRQGMLCHANPNDEELDKCIECGKEHEQLAGWLEELQRYKDLEEKGRLIELPCLPNEEVWESNKRFGAHKTLYASREAIVGAIEAGYAIGYTQEAAEAKLKEMEGAE